MKKVDIQLITQYNSVRDVKLKRRQSPAYELEEPGSESMSAEAQRSGSPSFFMGIG